MKNLIALILVLFAGTFVMTSCSDSGKNEMADAKEELSSGDGRDERRKWLKKSPISKPK